MAEPQRKQDDKSVNAKNSTSDKLNGSKAAQSTEKTVYNSRSCEHLKEVQFKPGQSGNPKGRPKGVRNKLSSRFLKDLREVWESEVYNDEGKIVGSVGHDVIMRVAEKEPAKLLTAMVAVLPKDFQVSVRDESEGRWVINAQPLSIEEWQAKHGLDRTDTIDIDPDD